MSPQDMIPQEKCAAVSQALREAFDVTSYEDIRRVTGGRSPNIHVFRIVVQGRPYLLRVIMRSDDPTRHFTSMRAAAEAGLAPHVWYTSIPDRISITDFVEAVPFPRIEAPRRMAATLRALHAVAPFPPVPDAINTSCTFLLHRGQAVDDFIGRIKASNVLTPGECDELLSRWFEQLAAVYPLNDSEMVSSHNDLFKPDNILFDGNRVWLVDWEAAFSNDRYTDLAVVANLVVTNAEEEKLYLEEYFGHAPDEYQLARFYLMQQLTHIFYGMAFLWIGSLGGPVKVDEVPSWSEFHRKFWTGEIKLEDNYSKTIYGRVHLNRLFENVRQPRIHEAMRIVSASHTLSQAT